MDDKVVYRSLRKISAWALDGFYSDVHVSGQENVPETGPVILTPCHHNEILDIATLSVTIPHRRPICFWAKSSMFTNPIMKAIMTSSGSIPVRRNPNSSSNSFNRQDEATDARFSLFRETFRALDADEVIGVFPEGTSYTEPQIAQIKEGAAWVALEYARWQLHNAAGGAQGKRKKLTLIPVGIVYDDKTRFNSRVFVHFGEPIDLERYSRRHLASADPRIEVRSLTSQMEAKLYKLTVNAASWDLYFAARIARDTQIEGVKKTAPEDFVGESQLFIDHLSAADDHSATNALVKYYALLHYTGISHNTLATLFPTGHQPTRLQGLVVFSRQLVKSIAHPLSLAFIPVGLVHLPAYITGALAGRYLANAKEPETVAEHKVVCGGLAFGATSALIGSKVYGLLHQGLSTTVQDGRIRVMSDLIGRVSSLLPTGSQGWIAGRACRLLGMVTVIYWTTWALFRWHRALVPWNYKQLQSTSASWTILISTCFPPFKALTSAQLAGLSRPPLPAPNPYIKRRVDLAHSDAVSDSAKHPTERHNKPPRPPAARYLVSHLFAARADAEAAVLRVFGGSRASARP